MRLLAVYRALLTVQFQAAAQYRIQSVLWMLFSVIRPVIFLAAWVAVANARGGAVAGYSVADFAAYFIAMTLVSHLTMAWNSHEFEWEIQHGRLSPKLLRPLHPLHYAVGENIIFKVTTIVPLALILGLLALTFGVEFRTTRIDVLLFVPSLVLAAALLFIFGWAVATLAFWVTRMNTANTLWMRAAFVFSGVIAPVAVMPDWLQAVTFGLPFWYMVGAPTEILLGTYAPEQALLVVAGQATWLVLSFLLFGFAWRRGLRQYAAVGA